MNKILSLLAVCLAIVPLSACKQEVSEKPAAKQEKAASVVIRPELNWDTPKLTSRDLCKIPQNPLNFHQDI